MHAIFAKLYIPNYASSWNVVRWTYTQLESYIYLKRKIFLINLKGFSGFCPLCWNIHASTYHIIHSYLYSCHHTCITNSIWILFILLHNSSFVQSNKPEANKYTLIYMFLQQFNWFCCLTFFNNLRQCQLYLTLKIDKIKKNLVYEPIKINKTKSCSHSFFPQNFFLYKAIYFSITVNDRKFFLLQHAYEFIEF